MTLCERARHCERPKLTRKRHPMTRTPKRQQEYDVVRKIDQASPSALFATQAWAWAAIVYGAVTIASGPQRHTGPTFVALNQVPGSPYIWGVLFIIAGATVKIGCSTARWKLRDTGIWLLTVMFLGFAGCFVFAAIVNPQAPIGGAVIYAAIALQLMVLRRLRGKPPTHDATNR